jgi:hypothetical protein
MATSTHSPAVQKCGHLLSSARFVVDMREKICVECDHYHVRQCDGCYRWWSALSLTAVPGEDIGQVLFVCPHCLVGTQPGEIDPVASMWKTMLGLAAWVVIIFLILKFFASGN